MRDKIFLDTNILVYLANQDSPFHSSVHQTFQEIKKENDLWISRQVLREYAVVMTRVSSVEKPLPSISVVNDIKKFKKIFFVADDTTKTTEILLHLVQKYSVKGKAIHDANIVATMIANNIGTLFTINFGDFKRFKEVMLIGSKSSEG